MNMVYLTKEYKFCAAHKYWNSSWSNKKNKEVFGEDINIHGHNYLLAITVKGPSPAINSLCIIFALFPALPVKLVRVFS